MARDLPHAIVIGWGVSGLTSGICLLEAGFAVTIVARDLPPDTTSNVAGAVWYPYKAYPEDRVLGWGAAAVEAFYGLLDEPAAGVRLIQLTEVFEYPVADPWWMTAVRVFRRATTAELPPGYVDGYSAEVPLIETPVYMPYLVERFRRGGGRTERRAVAALDELAGQASLIVNCSGLGARELVGDQRVHPIRGQIALVEPIEVGRCLIDDYGALGMAYVIPRRDAIVLGGTADHDSWDLGVDDGEAAAIVERCRRVMPALREARVIGHRVGLRPGRDEVRLELERLEPESGASGAAVIHNYGHGGAGFTLSWGCAREVVELAKAIINGQ